MTDRMTIDEAREWLVDYVNVMFLSNTSTRRFRQILALLDHLAARVEAHPMPKSWQVDIVEAMEEFWVNIWDEGVVALGFPMKGSVHEAVDASRSILGQIGVDAAPIDAALARWEGLSK